MTKFLLSVFLAGILFYCFSQDKPINNKNAQLKEYAAAEAISQKAEHLYYKAGDNENLLAQADEVYRQALKAFKLLIAGSEKNGNDSLLFMTYLKAGFIEYYFDSADAAKKDYLAAIALKQKLISVADSFLFIPFLYTGGIYYNQNQFDSALSFYKKAETINDGYKKPLESSERLYNRLGVMYYENGNYRLARNYFEKAIASSDPSETNLLINYKINIGSLLVKLEEFKKAKEVYESLLPYNILTDEINHNLAVISLKLSDHRNAISYLKKVNYSDNKKSIDLNYNFGVAWSGLSESDSSEFYIHKAIAENTKWNGHKKNIPYGLILRFQADELVKKKNYLQAIQLYQQAIIQFVAGFNEQDIFKNPQEFSGVFSYINLFNTLITKADALELLYRDQKELHLLETSLETYRSAFKLADYVEKTYDSDEARLFLGKIKYPAHSKPIDACLLLYELTQKKEYIEDAYFFDQQNKASVLSLNVQENEIKSKIRASKEFFDKEASLKTAITRLSMKSAKLTDSQQLQSVNSAIREYEIQLGRLQEKKNNDPAYRNRYFASQIPGIEELQKRLDNKTALLSWHLSENEIIVFIITGRQLLYNKSPVSPGFFQTIDTLKESLYNTLTGERYNGTAFSTLLYKILIDPLEDRLSNIECLIIIPDDELNYLPFEALMDERGNYLVEKFSIQYQYSTALLGKDKKFSKAKGTLAFAPFASNGYSDSSGTLFSVLPASKDETSNLPGKVFADSNAVKNNFLSAANHFEIIHLATHASVDNEIPLRSFIAFYPSTGKNTAGDYKLFAQEIYDLNLDSTQLVILSACETGAGKLVKGEGLMSLSRAFAYAGCPNIITSLWKAEDKTTAFITQKLHYYLEKGYTKNNALQQSKLDLLKSEEIDPRYKTPNFWAHLIFIGNYEPNHHSLKWWWIAITIIISALLYIIINKKAWPKSARRVFQGYSSNS